MSWVSKVIENLISTSKCYSKITALPIITATRYKLDKIYSILIAITKKKGFPISKDQFCIPVNAFKVVMGRNVLAFLLGIKSALSNLVVRHVFKWKMRCFWLIEENSVPAKIHNAYNLIVNAFKTMVYALLSVAARTVRTK